MPVSMVVYWMMILWLKQGDTCVNGGLLNDDALIKESDTCVNGGLLNDDILIKTKWLLTNVAIVVYGMMIFCLKQSDTWKLKQSDICVNSGLLNDDTLIKRRWYLCQ